MRKLKPEVETKICYWSAEFAELLEVEHQEIFDEVVKLSVYTMIYQVADLFIDDDVNTREKILNHYFKKK